MPRARVKPRKRSWYEKLIDWLQNTFLGRSSKLKPGTKSTQRGRRGSPGSQGQKTEQSRRKPATNKPRGIPGDEVRKRQLK